MRAKSNETPRRLYKYVPSRYAEEVLSGKLLFRNLAYFRQSEDLERGDSAEGMHIDRPDEPISVQTVDGSVSTKAAAFHNEVNQEEVFVFCLSTKLDSSLMEEFGCDSVIEIHQVPRFLARVRAAVGHWPSLAKRGLHSKAVDYYLANRPAPASVKDPLQLPFYKPMRFCHQHEFRLVVAKKQGLQLKMSLVTDAYSYRDAANKHEAAAKLIKIKGMHTIARQIT